MKRLKGWKIRLIPDSSEGYCWEDRKIIDLGLEGNPLSLLLHEVAHIGNNPHGNKHNQKWFDEYLKLMCKYMPGIEIDKSDKIIQKVYKLKEQKIFGEKQMKNTKDSLKLWYKFYECNCHDEGIMMSYDYTEEGMPTIDIAFFQHGFSNARQPLTFKERCRWIWNIITKGRPFLDGVMLSQKIAKELADDLLEFYKVEYKFGDKNENK